MALNRRLFFKIEKLDNTEIVLEEKSVILTSGNIDVGLGGFRRKCNFTLLEDLPATWQGYRWKLYYGYATTSISDPIYYSLGVFIPINPSKDEVNSKFVTNYQGVDKVKLFADYQIDVPVTFTSGTNVRDIIITVAGWFGETKLNIESSIGTLGVDLTFVEGTTAQSILDTIVSSFSDEWFYDTDGYLIGRKVVSPTIKPVRFVMDDASNPIYITASTDIDDSNYYNSVTVVGGMVDTPIYRTTLSDSVAIALANRTVKRYFTIDAAVTQAQVDGRAAYYLSGGVQLPVLLRLTNLVIPNLEIGDIIQKNGINYETRSFNVPLGLESQSIAAGKVVFP